MRPCAVLKCLLTVLLLSFLAGGRAKAQDDRTDTLRLTVSFQRGASVIDADFRDNGVHMREFRKAVESRLREGCVPGTVFLRGSSSPEGVSSDNDALAGLRAQALEAWLTDNFGPRFGISSREAGEGWADLARIIRTLDVPWRDAALKIIESEPVADSRENTLRGLAGGAAWNWLDANVFPDLRTASVSVCCTFSRQLPVPADTVYITQTVRDTVYVDATPLVQPAPEPAGPDFTDRRMLFALRTNVLAVPFLNLGLELPLGRRWSVGADVYYPWLWRSGHADGVDKTGSCIELMAADLELRYWFPRRNMQDGQRLLGHSIGVYGAAGHFDFERDWSGLQGEFYDVGLDYLYAAPLFRGRMHLEAEIGLGFLWSTGRPYDCPDPGGVIFHRRGVTQNTTWIGPTRAQLSLVVPIYTAKKGGAR